MRTKVKAVRGPKPRSRYATRPRVRNKERAGALRRFLLDTYGLEALQAGAGVLDVAGGSGSLAFELRNLNGVAVTVVDPRPLTLRKLLRKWEAGMYFRTEPLQKYNSAVPATLESARAVHAEWQAAAAAAAAPGGGGGAAVRPHHWAMCFEAALWGPVVGAAEAPPSDAELDALQTELDRLAREAAALRWTSKGLEAGGRGSAAADDGGSASDGDGDDDGEAAAPPLEVPTAAEAWRVLREASMVVGMHPDAAAEAIVDYGLASGKPFALVPCCVYSEMFPKRKDASGRRVTNYEQLVAYLVAKDPARIRVATLPFEGKNRVVYSAPPGEVSCGVCEEAAPTTTCLTDLPTDALSLVLYRLLLAHDIAATASVCRAFCDAARHALAARPYTGEVVTLAGHSHWVKCVAAAPDGRVITGSGDDTVKVWRDGACERTIEAHTHSVRAVAVLPGGARFVSGSEDGTAKLWTLDGALERTFEVGNVVRCVAALPDGVHFVVGTSGGFYYNNEVRLYHVDGTLVHTFKGHNGYVASVAATRDGQHIISSADKLVKVWRVASKSLVSTCAGHTRGVEAVAAMPDGQRFLSGSDDNTVRVWRLNGTLENSFELHTDTLHIKMVNAVVALPDNQHALSGSEDKTVKLFNVNDGSVLRTFKHHTDRVNCLALLPDGLRFVSASSDETACIVEHGLARL